MSAKRCGVRIGLFVVIGWMSAHANAADWAFAPGLNEPRQTFAAAVDECGNIWVLGGWNRTGGCSSGTGPMADSVEKLAFDGSSYAAQWELTPIVMPTTRRNHSAVVSRGFIYVLGGGDFGAEFPLAQVDRFDTLSGTWSSIAVPAMTEPRFDGAAITDSLGRIWSIGGQPNNASFSDVVTIFDPARPELGWQTGPSLNQVRARCGCVLDRKGRIYVIGGYATGIHVQTVERIDPCSESTWTVLPESLPEPTTNDDPAVLGADGRIYVVGGWKAHYWIDRVLRLDPENGVWETWSPLAEPRDLIRVVLGHDDYIYAIGGEVPGCVSTANVEKLYTGQLPCDINGDADVNGLDIQPFVDAILGF